jgi:hypothetical protein
MVWLQLRSTTERVHEIEFGLPYCQTSSCVMHFRKSLLDTDFKGHTFCSNCKVLLVNTYQYDVVNNVIIDYYYNSNFYFIERPAKVILYKAYG